MTKRKKIIEQAITLFSEQGIESTTVQQITDSCGISKGAFYLSFSSKDELVTSVIEDFLWSVATEIDRVVRKAETSEDLLIDYFLAILNHLHSNHPFARVLLTDIYQSISHEMVERMAQFDQVFLEKIKIIVIHTFPNIDETMKLDVAYYMRGIVGIYAEQLILGADKIDRVSLAKAFKERVVLIGEQAKLPILTTELVLSTHQKEPFNEQTVREALMLLTVSEDNDFVRGAAEELMKQLDQPEYSDLIVMSLIHTLAIETDSKWLGIALKEYFIS